MSKLYVVGTPIGNLEDITFRAINTLKNVDFIAAEDTRVTVKLLNHFSINTPMVAYHKHSGKTVEERIVARILSGEVCALVSDAGMPCISDPGVELVGACVKNNINIEVIPSCTAFTTAIAGSALPTGRFCFEGFLSTNKNSRSEHLTQLKNEQRTMIFYEAPHRILDTLKEMQIYFGGDRKITIARELTKLHEEFLRVTIDEAIFHYTDSRPRGEFVLVVAGAEAVYVQYSIDEALSMVKANIEAGVSLKEAVSLVAEGTGIKRNDIYRLAVKQFGR